MANLLLVEDDASVRRLVTLQLSLVGYDVRAAEDAAAARALLADGAPDLAILDIMLPGEDGFSLAETMIEREIPVLFLPSRRVTKDGREVALTALEFDLLAMLVRRNNVALSREALLAGVWGYAYQGETRTVDVHIQRLRGKIGAEYIETVYKYGYRFCGKEVERR